MSPTVVFNTPKRCWPMPECRSIAARRAAFSLRPRPGECCVFCSYGSEKCPMKQDETNAV